MLTMRRLSCSLIALLATGLLVVGCGGDSDDSGQAPSTDAPRVEDPGPIHVHGLGVNPEDGALFVATHTGLFRAGEGERKATRVADRFQDTMGFTVVGPNRFLGSGHPDGREGLPPFLGLIESRDAGRTWRPISLLGKRDFHVLEAAGKRVYGFGSDFETKQAALLVSDDGGRSWEEHAPPEGLISLAIDPEDRDRIVVSGETGLYSSSDAGRGWRPLDGEPALAIGKQLNDVGSRFTNREQEGRVEAQLAPAFAASNAWAAEKQSVTLTIVPSSVSALQVRNPSGVSGTLMTILSAILRRTSASRIIAA